MSEHEFCLGKIADLKCFECECPMFKSLYKKLGSNNCCC